LIRRALSVGFSLPELTAILKIRDQGGVPCHRVRALAGSKLSEVQERIKELVVMRKQLEQTLKNWDSKLARVRPGEQARLLEGLPESIASRRLTVRSLKNMNGARK
jgi:DNA-binding transcriptional MerR regulator